MIEQLSNHENGKSKYAENKTTKKVLDLLQTNEKIGKYLFNRNKFK